MKKTTIRKFLIFILLFSSILKAHPGIENVSFYDKITKALNTAKTGFSENRSWLVPAFGISALAMGIYFWLSKNKEIQNYPDAGDILDQDLDLSKKNDDQAKEPLWALRSNPNHIEQEESAIENNISNNVGLWSRIGANINVTIHEQKEFSLNLKKTWQEELNAIAQGAGFAGICKMPMPQYFIVDDNENNKLLQGIRTNASLKPDSKGKVLNEEILAGQYKIHLMPTNQNIRDVFASLLNNIKTNSTLQKCIANIKICSKLDEPQNLNRQEILPRIVIYPANGKKNAQTTLNILYKLFSNQKGLSKIPRYNKYVTSLIYIAQGDGDSKKKESLAQYFTPDKIYYNPKFIKPEKGYADHFLYHPESKISLAKKVFTQSQPLLTKKIDPLLLTEETQKKERVNSYLIKEARKEVKEFYSKQRTKGIEKRCLEESSFYQYQVKRIQQMLMYKQLGTTLVKSQFNGTDLNDYSYDNHDAFISNLLTRIVSFVHHLCVIAEKKNQIFTEGTFIIEDTNKQAIYTMLKNYVQLVYNGDKNKELCPQELLQLPESNTKAYPRISSHFNSYYLAQGVAQSGWLYGVTKTDPDYTHYGITIPNNHFLPYPKMRHLLFGWVNKEKNILFIKMEENGPHTYEHAINTGKSIARKTLPTALDFMQLGTDDEPDYRKERIPDEILNKFSQLVQDKEKQQNAKAFGISYMYEILKRDIEDEQQEWNLNNPKTAFCKQLEKTYDNLHGRIGNEVYIPQEDLFGACPTLEELIDQEITRIEKNFNLENITKQALPIQMINDFYLEKRLNTLIKKAQQEIVTTKNTEFLQKLSAQKIKLKKLNDELPYVLTLISGDDDTTFYEKYKDSFYHLKKYDNEFNIWNLYETIDLDKKQKYMYSVDDIIKACDNKNESIQTPQGQIIRQIKFSLSSEKAKNAYDAFLEGKESLYMHKIDSRDAKLHNLTPARSERLKLFKTSIDELEKSIQKFDINKN